MTKPQRLILMRGLPGSGKSFQARRIVGDGPVFSADDYFEVEGEYRFDRDALGEAHRATLRRLIAVLEAGVSPVVIDNTHSRAWEMRPYVEAGLRFDYRIEFAFPTSPWAWDLDELARRNQHGVPRDAIEAMLERFEMTPSLEEILTAEAP